VAVVIAPCVVATLFVATTPVVIEPNSRISMMTPVFMVISVIVKPTIVIAVKASTRIIATAITAVMVLTFAQ
jgi:hypothetical protein